MKKEHFKLVAVIFTVLIIGFTACEKDPDEEPDPNATLYEENNGVVTVTDKGLGTGTMTWTKDQGMGVKRIGICK